MSLEEVRDYLNEHFGVPVVLRKKGETEITCPYCGQGHHHQKESGHYVALCDEGVREGVELVIGNRRFVPGYGHDVIHFKERDNVNVILEN